MLGGQVRRAACPGHSPRGSGSRLLDDADVRAGPPVPTMPGPLTADAPSGDRMALLTWVPGTPLVGDDEDERRLIGATLARVHRMLRDREVPGAHRFHGVGPAAPRLGLRPWIRPTVSTVVNALEALRRRAPGWPQGLLHADPAPGAFRYDPATGDCGVIDWSSALHGPLLYDRASAVLYLGGRTAPPP